MWVEQRLPRDPPNGWDRRIRVIGIAGGGRPDATVCDSRPTSAERLKPTEAGHSFCLWHQFTRAASFPDDAELQCRGVTPAASAARSTPANPLRRRLLLDGMSRHAHRKPQVTALSN
jgi:hypothetical protein